MGTLTLRTRNGNEEKSQYSKVGHYYIISNAEHGWFILKHLHKWLILEACNTSTILVKTNAKPFFVRLPIQQIIFILLTSLLLPHSSGQIQSINIFGSSARKKNPIILNVWNDATWCQNFCWIMLENKIRKPSRRLNDLVVSFWGRILPKTFKI